MEKLNVSENLSRTRTLSSVERLLVLRLYELAILVQMSFWFEFPRILNLFLPFFIE